MLSSLPRLFLRPCTLLGCFIVSSLHGIDPAQAAPEATNASPEAVPAAVVEFPKQPRMEVVFVLDTTGSMAGLIAGAQQKIWAIANKLKAAKPTPEIRFGLIAYRDRGDQYVTRLHGLDANIDQVNERLFAFEAAGGGDGPESVNEALHLALTEIQWTEDPEVLRLLFLVGDAPPHMDYQDDTPYPESCARAVEMDITINTLQCGDMPGTDIIWKEIARRTNGVYAQIAQDGDSRRITTEYDAAITAINIKLDATVIPYGSIAEQNYALSNTERLRGLSKEAIAERSSFFGKTESGRIMAGSGDLVALLLDGDIDLENIDPEQLRPDLKALSVEERNAFVEEQIAKRRALNAELRELVAKRDAEVKRQLEAIAESDHEVFELNAFQIIETQAEGKGFGY